jgi:hypothetical protein
MLRNRFLSISFMIFGLMAFAGCGNQDASIKGDGGSTASAANTNTAPPVATPVPASATAPPPTLSAEYILSEVQHDGQVTIIRKENTTEISFRPDGTFARVSRLGGKVDHSDSGEFRIEDGKQLVLRIQMSKRKIQTRPVEKKHKFTLSSDGSELRLIGADGKVGVFRRTKVFTAN